MSSDEHLVAAVLKQAKDDDVDPSSDPAALVRIALQVRERMNSSPNSSVEMGDTEPVENIGDGFHPGLGRSLTEQFLNMTVSNSAAATAAPGKLPKASKSDGNVNDASRGDQPILPLCRSMGNLMEEGSERRADSAVSELAGTLSHMSTNAVRLLQATTRVLEWMSTNEDHLRPLVDLVVTSVYELMNCQRVTLYFVDHAKQELWIALAKDAAVRGLRIPLGSGIAGHVALTGEAVLSNDCYDSKNFNSMVDADTGFHTQTMICAPIFSQHHTKVTAVLSAINKRSTPPGAPPIQNPVIERMAPASECVDSPLLPGQTVIPFSDDDLRILQTFCMQVGLALRKCTLQLALAKMVADHDLVRQQDVAIVTAQQSLFAEFASPSPAHHCRSTSSENLQKSVRDVRVALGREAQERAASRSGSRSRSSTAGCEADELDGSQGDASDVVGEERTVLASPILTTLPAHIDLGDGTEIAMSDVRNWQLDVPSMTKQQLRAIGVNLLLEYQPVDIDIPLETLTNFVNAIASQYKDLPFHNFKHGFSVLHICYMMLRECPRAHQNLSYHKRFALLVAALCHDVGHPGVNNNFLVNTGHEIAIAHNDDAVLERYHAVVTFKTLSRQDCNIFVSLDLQAFQKVRRTIIEAILGTEMSRHMKMLEQLNAITDVDAAFLDPPGQALLIKTLVHSADLSGQALSFDVAARWGDAVLIEFADQSRREAEAGVPLTPHMVGLDDRNGTVAINMQQGFVQHFILPLWESMARVHPELQHFVDNASANARRYRSRLDARKKQNTQGALAE